MTHRHRRIRPSRIGFAARTDQTIEDREQPAHYFSTPDTARTAGPLTGRSTPEGLAAATGGDLGVRARIELTWSRIVVSGDAVPALRKSNDDTDDGTDISDGVGELGAAAGRGSAGWTTSGGDTRAWKLAAYCDDDTRGATTGNGVGVLNETARTEGLPDGAA